MTYQVAIFLLPICAALTSLITEGIKKMTTVNKPTVVAAIVSVIVGAAVPVGYYLVNGIAFATADIVYLVGMVLLTWLSATVGYDKIIEVINQLKGVK